MRRGWLCDRCLQTAFLCAATGEYNEPGVLMAFEETPEDIARNVASLGFDIQDLAHKKKLFLDYVSVEPQEIQESGEYDLEGLFIRLQSAVDAVGAKRVMFDTVEAIFSGFSNTGMLRAEFRRLFRWLKDRQLTTVITAERGEGTLTRHGLEGYVYACGFSARHWQQIERGRPITCMTLLRISVVFDDFAAIAALWSSERVSSAAPSYEMLEGKGYYRGSSVLLTGTAGSGKTTLAASFVDAACRRGERCLYIDFEESRHQVARNMRSVGIDLERWAKKRTSDSEAWRPTQFGIEMHLLRIHKFIEKVKPQCVVIDPITTC